MNMHARPSSGGQRCRDNSSLTRVRSAEGGAALSHERASHAVGCRRHFSATYKARDLVEPLDSEKIDARNKRDGTKREREGANAQTVPRAGLVPPGRRAINSIVTRARLGALGNDVMMMALERRADEEWGGGGPRGWEEWWRSRQ